VSILLNPVIPETSTFASEREYPAGIVIPIWLPDIFVDVITVDVNSSIPREM
jgi:hypothetical protein